MVEFSFSASDFVASRYWGLYMLQYCDHNSGCMGGKVGIRPVVNVQDVL